MTWFCEGNKNGGIFMDVVNHKVRERMRSGKPDTFRDFFENFMSDKTGEISLDYSEILRESNIFIAAGNVCRLFCSIFLQLLTTSRIHPRLP
jgi:hypothetical protein